MTAANVWQGKACRIVEKGGGEYAIQCVVAKASPLRLNGEDIPNPFEGTASYDPSEGLSSYQALAHQLRDEEKNIEYAAAILEQGALRAYAIGLEPSAFNSVTWYERGCQTNQEIFEGWVSGGQGGSAIFALDNIPVVLDVWGLNTTWGLDNEPQYWYWREQLGW